MASVSDGASDTTRSGRPALLGGGAQAISALATGRTPRRITSRTFTAPARLSTRAYSHLTVVPRPLKAQAEPAKLTSPHCPAAFSMNVAWSGRLAGRVANAPFLPITV